MSLSTSTSSLSAPERGGAPEHTSSSLTAVVPFECPGIRTMLVIFSSIVSVLELAAAQSFVAFTIIASRARRTRAARCLLAQHPRHTPCGGMVGLMMEKSASISSSGEFKYLLRNSFSSNELTLCSL